VASTPGAGSVFEFTLRLEKSGLGVEAAAERSGELPDFSGRRVLLVEDIEINRLMVIDLLAETTREIDDACDGRDGLEKFAAAAEYYYDLVFMDVQMPNLDGYEATRAIRALERPDAKTTPIIAMTANAYREDIERALAAGMNAHLAKPIDINEVAGALSHWLPTV
jgi:CheY-like chemotaxis protein